MTVSPRWSLGLGLAALLVSGALAAIGASASGRSAPPAVPAAARGALASIDARPAGADALRQPTASESAPASIASGSRHRALESALRPLMLQPRLRAGAFGFDPETATFFDVGGDEPFSAASLIKVPIAVALLVECDRGSLSLDEPLELRPGQVAGGSGSLQYFPAGSRFSIGRLAELMIRRSDNTATNMLIDRLGGMRSLNEVFAAWGLTRTRLRNDLPDLAGTNTTSPRDLVDILRRAMVGGLLRDASKQRLLAWMRRSHVRSLLPAGVGRGALVANKTGDIPGALGDAGFVEAPGGRRYFLAVQVERPRNSSRAKELIRNVSRSVYASLSGRRELASRAGRAASSLGRAGRAASKRTRAS